MAHSPIQNRNIGVAKRNFGKNNHLTAPGEWLHAGRLFDPVKTDSSMSATGIRLLREHTLTGYSHALSLPDIENILAVVPSEDLSGIKWITQIQPSHKQELLGRLWASYYAEIKIGSTSGSMLVLYAIKPSYIIKWDSHLNPFYEQELQRLMNEGHTVTKERRGYSITTTPESARATQYRSLLHEIGHHVDRLRNPDSANKPYLEREKFAEHYVRRYGTYAGSHC